MSKIVTINGKAYIRVNGKMQRYYTGRRRMTDELRQAMEKRYAPKSKADRERARLWNDFLAP